MKIEWATGGRRPRPSVMHGWLAKMRGTILGDEDLRSKGIREMKDAQYYKQVTAQRSPPPSRRPTPQRRDTGSSALFGTLNPKPRPVPVRRGTPSRTTSGQRVVGQTRRPSGHSSASSGRRYTSAAAPTPQHRPPQRRQNTR
ncbi:hypothetical protein MKEN_00105800 [Mycena kentingensis (nom. inval.)]|nr:hypothetical protein MKEN_00105800 [Mycena kentingensis (nom. inval.)]